MRQIPTACGRMRPRDSGHLATSSRKGERCSDSWFGGPSTEPSGGRGVWLSLRRVSNPQVARKLVCVVRPNLHPFFLQKGAALPDRGYKTVDRLPFLDTVDNRLDDLFPVRPLYLRINPGISQHVHMVFQETQEDQNPRPVSGIEHFFGYERLESTVVYASLNEASSRQEAFQEGYVPHEQGSKPRCDNGQPCRHSDVNGQPERCEPMEERKRQQRSSSEQRRSLPFSFLVQIARLNYVRNNLPGGLPFGFPDGVSDS